MVNLLQIARKALFQARKLRPVGIKADTEKGDVKRHSSAPDRKKRRLSPYLPNATFAAMPVSVADGKKRFICLTVLTFSPS
jgi:hypothetical protein